MVELQVLNYVVQNRDTSFFANNAIDEKFFTTYDKEFMFIKNHIEKYGVTPDMATFIDKFPDFVPAEVHETAEYLSSQLYEEYNMQLVLKSYKKVFESFKAKDYSGGLEEINSISKQLVSNIPIKPVDLITDTSRYDRFVEKSKNLDTYYVTTGFPELDEVLEGGWDRKNEIATIVARPGLGKTWILLKCAVAAAMKGLKVGIYSGEMDEDMIGYRVDTLIGNLPNALLSHGNISVQAEYKDYIDHLNKMVPGSILVLTPEMNRRKLATVSDLQAFVEKEHLDMLCIDQHSLMEDERKGRDPITIAANICKDIKRLQTLEHIPIVAVSQQNRGKDDEEDKELDVSRIAQTDRIGQDSSIVLFLQHNHTNDTLTIVMAKVRNGPTGKKLKYAIDLNKGIFTYLPSDGDASPRNQEEIMHQQMEFDGYDASKEDLVEFTGEDIF